MNKRQKPVATKHVLDVFHSRLEKMLVNHSLWMHWYYLFNRRMTLDEFHKAQLPDNTKVLCIGSGSFPWTLIILGEEKKWKIVGIDKDKEAVRNGREMIARFKLSHNVQIQEGDGLNYDISSYDLIAVALGARPQTVLLNRLSRDMKPKAKIIFRGTWEPFNKLYGEEDIPDSLKIVDVYYRLDGVKSYLLKKNEKNL